MVHRQKISMRHNFAWNSAICQLSCKYFLDLHVARNWFSKKLIGSVGIESSIYWCISFFYHWWSINLRLKKERVRAAGYYESSPTSNEKKTIRTKKKSRFYIEFDWCQCLSCSKACVCRFRLLFEGCVDDGFVCPLQYTLSQETVDYLKKPTFDIWHWEPNEVRTQSYSCRQKLRELLYIPAWNYPSPIKCIPKERIQPSYLVWRTRCRMVWNQRVRTQIQLLKGTWF